MKGRSRRLIGSAALLALVLFSGLIPQTASSAAASRGTQAAPLRSALHGPPYTIALSNSYIGHTWRVEMENEFKAACAMAPFKSLVKCSVFNSNNTVSTQIQQ